MAFKFIPTIFLFVLFPYGMTLDHCNKPPGSPGDSGCFTVNQETIHLECKSGEWKQPLNKRGCSVGARVQLFDNSQNCPKHKPVCNGLYNILTGKCNGECIFQERGMV